eukprot:m.94858 g.94858  ORF g.94858 m.94858 type:complete len:53 (+) comp18401_c1_seq1:172-330(+)
MWPNLIMTLSDKGLVGQQVFEATAQRLAVDVTHTQPGGAAAHHGLDRRYNGL